MIQNNYINNPLSKEEKVFLLSASKKAKKGNLLNSDTRKNLYLAGKQEKWFISNISYFFNSISSYALFFSKDKPSYTYKILVKTFELLMPKEKSNDMEVLYQTGKIYADFFLKTEDLITYTDKDDEYQSNMYFYLSNYLWSGKAEKKYLSNFASSKYKTHSLGVDDEKEITPLFIRALDCYESAADKDHYMAKKGFCSQYLLYPWRIDSKKTFKKVLKILTELSKNGDSESQCALGNILCAPSIYGGDEDDYNGKKAIELWQQAAEKYSPEAWCSLGYTYYFGRHSLKENKKQGMELLITSANSKDKKSSITQWNPSEAQYQLAQIFLNDEKIDSNLSLKKHEYWLKRVIEGNNKLYNSLAYNDLGDFYYNKNSNESYKEAKLMYQKASALGSHEATVSLGDLYRHGLGVKKNIKKAISYYLIAIELAVDTDALINLGEIYYNGEGVRKNYTKAKEHFEDAVEYGNSSEAMNYLGCIHQYGHGVKKNISKAKKYFKDAITENHEVSYINLARIYMGEENYDEGLKLYNQVIKDFESGYANLDLGKVYCYGWGVEINNNMALKYFLKAEKLGIDEAKNCINELDQENEDDEFKDTKNSIKKTINRILSDVNTEKRAYTSQQSQDLEKKITSTKTKNSINLNNVDSQISINEMTNMTFDDLIEIENLISREEDKFLEFKASLRTPYPDKNNEKSPNYKSLQKSLELTCLKTICGLLNLEGGMLIIGIHEKDTKKEIVGIEREFDSVNSRIKSIDSYQQHFHSIIDSQIGKKFVDYIDISIVQYKKKLICIVKITKLPYNTDAWLEDKFFIRVGNSTRQREGADLAFILKDRADRSKKEDY